jgi:hypothetical protein
VYELTAWNLINYGIIKEAVSLLEQMFTIVGHNSIHSVMGMPRDAKDGCSVCLS